MSEKTQFKKQIVHDQAAESLAKMDFELAALTDVRLKLQFNLGDVVLAAIEEPDDGPAKQELADHRAKLLATTARIAELDEAKKALKDREDRKALEKLRAEKVHRVSRFDVEIRKLVDSHSKRLEKWAAEGAALQREGRDISEKVIAAIPTPAAPGAAGWFAYSEMRLRLAHELDQHSEEYLGGHAHAKPAFSPLGAETYRGIDGSPGVGTRKAPKLSARYAQDIDFIVQYARNGIDRATGPAVPKYVGPTQTVLTEASVPTPAPSPTGKTHTLAEAEAMMRKPPTKLMIDTRRSK